MTINELVGISTEELESSTIEQLADKLACHFDNARKPYVPIKTAYKPSLAEQKIDTQKQLETMNAMIAEIKKNLGVTP